MSLITEEIVPGLHRMVIPLPKNPLKSLNSYVIMGKERNLLVDTGMNLPECQEALEAGLAELQVDLERTDIFVTHLHADHLGLAGAYLTDSNCIYFNRPDMEMLQEGMWERMGSFAARCGFPLHELRQALNRHPGRNYLPFGEDSLVLLQEGDQLQVGDYVFQCLETPGHTPGSICLYDSHKEIIITGDHVLGDITPNISLWLDEGSNPLKLYLDSLDKIYPLKVSLVLPGHRSLFSDLQKRILELKEHHQKRMDEIAVLLRRQPLDPYQLASRMTWDINARDWEDFPITQRWFASGEAMAHLAYMKEKGMVELVEEEPKMIFRHTLLKN